MDTLNTINNETNENGENKLSQVKYSEVCKKEKKTQNKLHKLQASYIHVGIFILQRKNHVGKGCRRKIPENTICIFLAKTGFYFAKTFYGKVNFCVFFAFFRVFEKCDFVKNDPFQNKKVQKRKKETKIVKNG